MLSSFFRYLSKLFDREREEVFDALLRRAIDIHPFPWRVDLDWAAQVRDSRGIVVAEFFGQGGAPDEFIRLAEQRANDLELNAKGLEQLDLFESERVLHLE